MSGALDTLQIYGTEIMPASYASALSARVRLRRGAGFGARSAGVMDLRVCAAAAIRAAAGTNEFYGKPVTFLFSRNSGHGRYGHG